MICSGKALPFADQRFGFCFVTVEHIRRSGNVARAIRRVLKPAGTAIADYAFMRPVHGYSSHDLNVALAGVTVASGAAARMTDVAQENDPPGKSPQNVLTPGSWRVGAPLRFAD
jgi:hypothetical protein